MVPQANTLETRVRRRFRTLTVSRKDYSIGGGRAVRSMERKAQQPFALDGLDGKLGSIFVAASILPRLGLAPPVNVSGVQSSSGVVLHRAPTLPAIWERDLFYLASLLLFLNPA
jgi:hypothetical protein